MHCLRVMLGLYWGWRLRGKGLGVKGRMGSLRVRFQG